MQGWIKLHRKILSSPMYRQLNSKQRDVMLTIMLLASHESNEWEFNGVMYTVEPGQFVTSIETIQSYCAADVSTQNIRTTLSKLERHRFLKSESTNRNRLISVVNWATYQAREDEESQQATNKLTNKQLTSKITSKNNGKTQSQQGVSVTSDGELTSKLNQNQQTLVDETNNYQEVRSKEVRSKDLKHKVIFETYTSNENLISTLMDFYEMRKKIKKPMTTDRTFSLLFNNLDKLASTDEKKIAVLEQSIFNNYQGIFALRDEAANNRYKKPLSKQEQNKAVLQRHMEGDERVIINDREASDPAIDSLLNSLPYNDADR